MKFLKKYHKWLGVILSLFIIFFSISGIILNHRELFSRIDVNRNTIPEEYRYNNWNNGAIKSSVELNADSTLIYGNLGVWLTDSDYSSFSNFNTGFPSGADNHKICKIIKTTNNNIFAASLFGLWKYSTKKQKWENINLGLKHKHIVDIIEQNNQVIVLSRSFVFKSTDYKTFEKITLKKPEIYDNKASLFKTLWFIHSGEIWGTIGILVVDLIGIIFIFLSITGIIFFVSSISVIKRQKNNLEITKLTKRKRWNLKWHNKIGWTTAIFLIITSITGVFLRPPLLITIDGAKVGKIPFTELAQDNPWFDKLKKIIYNTEKDEFIIASTDGIFTVDKNFKEKLVKIKKQPPISDMGVNVLKFIDAENILVGSFKGFFKWNIKTGYIQNYILKKEYIKPKGRGSPLSENLVFGYIDNYKGDEYYLDFNNGAVAISHSSEFAQMPEKLINQRFSLWNLALEVHTARIYKVIFGGLYILLIPILGFIILFILVSGFIIWWKKHR